MAKKRLRKNITIQFIAPYHQCETSLNASAMASFVMRKLKGVRSYKFQYLTPDPVSSYCTPFVDSHVYRMVSPRDFEFHSSSTEVIYWFGNEWPQLSHLRDSVSKNYLVANYLKWDKQAIRDSKHYSSVIMPCNSIAERSITLVSGLDSPVPIYPGSTVSASRVRKDLLDPSRISVLFSICSLQNPKSRLSILRKLRILLKHHRDVFITLLTDSIPLREERLLLEQLGLDYSDRLVIVDSFSDYEYTNMLKINDILIDMNPTNGVGYFMSAALNQGLAVCGFNQPLYRDLLCDGEYGMLLGGKQTFSSYGFDHVVPDWVETFNCLSREVLRVGHLRNWLDRRSAKPGYHAVLEQRVKSFFGMFKYLNSATIKLGEFAET